MVGYHNKSLLQHAPTTEFVPLPARRPLSIGARAFDPMTPPIPPPRR